MQWDGCVAPAQRELKAKFASIPCPERTLKKLERQQKAVDTVIEAALHNAFRRRTGGKKRQNQVLTLRSADVIVLDIRATVNTQLAAKLDSEVPEEPAITEYLGEGEEGEGEHLTGI